MSDELSQSTQGLEVPSEPVHGTVPAQDIPESSDLALDIPEQHNSEQNNPEIDNPECKSPECKNSECENPAVFEEGYCKDCQLKMEAVALRNLLVSAFITGHIIRHTVKKRNLSADSLVLRRLLSRKLADFILVSGLVKSYFDDISESRTVMQEPEHREAAIGQAEQFHIALIRAWRGMKIAGPAVGTVARKVGTGFERQSLVVGDGIATLVTTTENRLFKFSDKALTKIDNAGNAAVRKVGGIAKKAKPRLPRKAPKELPPPPADPEE
ncbi:MAG: hypothetical protein Q3972_07320 [Corynebacterium sp.]|nr:hypothetical protein [Corynebacterium sp.]